RELNHSQVVTLAGTEGANLPFFSPDGHWIGFFAEGRLKKTPVRGGAPTVLCDAPVGRGGDWGTDGTIVFAGSPAGLARISENGGKPELLVPTEPAEAAMRTPRWLPGGKAVIFGSNSSIVNWDLARIDVYSLADRKRKTLVRGGYAAGYV